MKRTLAGYLRIFACCAGVLLAVILWGSRVLPTAGSVERVQLVIDPGHGGEDGGAVSCTGVPESQINLEISLRLRDLFRLLGYDPTLRGRRTCPFTPPERPFPRRRSRT